MQKVIQFGVNDTLEVNRETVAQILLDFNAIQTDGTKVSVKDFSKIGFDIALTRGSAPSNPIPVFSGYLADLIQTMYANTKLENATRVLSGSTKVLLDFRAFPFVLAGNDKLTIRINADLSAFNGTPTKTASSITIETIPSAEKRTNGLIPVFQVYPVGNGEESFNDNLGSSVVRAVVTFGESNYADVDGKVSNLQLTASNDFNYNASENALIAQNIASSNVPDGTIKSLVAYSSPQALHGVKAVIKFTQGVSKDTKVLVMRTVRR